jgi:hypothetical protein
VGFCIANPRANGRDPSENVASITTSIQTATFNISQLNLSSAAPATAQMTTELINRVTSIHDVSLTHQSTPVAMAQACSVANYHCGPALGGAQLVNKYLVGSEKMPLRGSNSST